jgi:hypothetical protein
MDTAKLCQVFSEHRVSGSLSFHYHLRCKPYWNIQPNITPPEVAAFPFVIQNLNNVLNKDISDLRVMRSVPTREFDVGFYGPFVILLR